LICIRRVPLSPGVDLSWRFLVLMI
jgi:hypothetical protein